MLSPDGRCKTLDAAADGYVRAEACIVLRMEAAGAADSPAAAGGDSTCAVFLKGTFVNQAGPAPLTVRPEHSMLQSVSQLMVEL